jgi:hypothetical protein
MVYFDFLFVIDSHTVADLLFLINSITVSDAPLAIEDSSDEKRDGRSRKEEDRRERN